MKKSKLIDILSTFSKQEMKDFEKFIYSPFFEKERHVAELYKLLTNQYPEFEELKVGREKLYSRLFKNEKFNEKKLKNITYELTKLAEQFLIHNSILKNEINSELILAKVYRNKKAEKLFFKTISLLEKKIDKLLLDEYNTLQMMEESSHLTANFYFWKNDFDKTIENELLYTEYFTLSFVTRFFKKLQVKQIITSRYNKDFSNPLFDSLVETIDMEGLLKLLREKNYRYLWLIEIYYHAYRCSNGSFDNEADFHRLKELFYEHIDKFSENEKQNLFIDLTHYCIIQKDEMNNPKYEQEQFEIYKQIINDFTSDNEFFNMVLFRSIITSAISLNEYDWLENFIDNYIRYLKPEYAENMENLSRAHLSFARNNYHESLEYLSKIKYDIFLYKIDVKNLMLRNYYELSLFEQAYSMIDAYKHFLQETKEYTAIQQKVYGKFIHFFNKLLKAKVSKDIDQTAEFDTNPDFNKGLPSYAWLKEKVEELKSVISKQ